MKRQTVTTFALTLTTTTEDYPKGKRKQEIYVRNTVLVIHTHDSKNDMEKAICFLLQKDIPFIGIEIAQPTLEDVFLRLTSKSEGE